jgi:2-polyprenyl-6-methoxyphenol hydroxylase-like FAD-dependent oxidoreductase
MMKLKSDVMVVGGGPVGLMLACELRLAGLDVVLLERRDERIRDSRALGMHARTVETLALRGLAPRFVENGRPFGQAHYGALETRLDMSVLDTAHPYQLVIPQSKTEQLLEERAQELGVRLHRGALAEEVWQDEHTACVSGRIGEERFEAVARFVVGADGGRSLVRREAGIDFIGHDASVTSILGDVRLGAELPVPALMKANDEGVLFIVPLGDGVHHRLIVIDARRCHTPMSEPVTLEELADGAARIAGTDYLPSQPQWLSRFSDETRHASHYRKGRILLAGDAAHIHMPAGGQGMNVGIQDAFNLGWKLASVVKGEAPAALLDTYHQERWPLGEQLMKNTMAQTTLLTAFDERGMALRAALSDLLLQPEANRQLAMQISGLGIGYPAALAKPAGATLPEWTGRRIPDWQLELDDGTQTGLHGLMHGGEWLYLRLRDEAPLSMVCPGRLRTVRASLPAPRQPGEDRPPAHSSLAACRAGNPAALLIRPDGYADHALA